MYSDEYGKINAEFGNMAIKKGKSYGGVALYDILPHIPQIFENAIVLDTKPDDKADINIKGIVDLVGCATLNDKYLAIVKLNVKEYANDEAKIYDNRVLTIEELTVVERVNHQEANVSSDHPSSAVSSEYIIACFREFVKENNGKNKAKYDLADDATYLSAVESGDMETAQRMVEEATAEDLNTDHSQAALEEFGTTYDIEKTGFVLPDGRQLNLSPNGFKGVYQNKYFFKKYYP